MRRRWYALERNEGAAELSIFDEIGGFGVSVAAFKRDFDEVKGSREIRLLLNSPGGSVFDGMALYNLLSSARERLSVEVVGVAASVASIVALAGRELRMGEGSYLMIHNPWALVVGAAAEMRRVAEVLDKMRGELAGIYAGRSALSREDLLTKMDAETWFTAAEAVEAGFADEVVEHGEVAALAYDLGRYDYRRVPGRLRRTPIGAKDRQEITERFVERLLRDAGCDREEAEVVANRGVRALRRGDPGADRGEPGPAATYEASAEELRRNIATLGGQNG